MISIIVATNRKGATSAKIANHYLHLFQSKGAEVQLLDMQDLPNSMLHNLMYSLEGQDKDLSNIQDKYLIGATKMLFVVPEYNGSFPGIVKLFIDACSIRSNAENFRGKRAAIVGVSSGRAGNLRGMEHLTGVLNYLGVCVMPNRLPISVVESLLNEEGSITDEGTLKAIEQQIEEFIKF